MLAKEFLQCLSGPCVALETSEGSTVCGLVRNPIAYLFQAAHPDSDTDVLGAPPAIELGHQLSVKFAAALGVGQGCDAIDDQAAAAWPVLIPARCTE